VPYSRISVIKNKKLRKVVENYMVEYTSMALTCSLSALVPYSRTFVTQFSNPLERGNKQKNLKPQRTQRMQKNSFLCVLCALCGERMQFFGCWYPALNFINSVFNGICFDVMNLQRPQTIEILYDAFSVLEENT